MSQWWREICLYGLWVTRKLYLCTWGAIQIRVILNAKGVVLLAYGQYFHLPSYPIWITILSFMVLQTWIVHCKHVTWIVHCKHVSIRLCSKRRRNSGENSRDNAHAGNAQYAIKSDSWDTRQSFQYEGATFVRVPALMSRKAKSTRESARAKFHLLFVSALRQNLKISKKYRSIYKHDKKI